ncbi:hypothetical protein DV738_g4907, partial [Chaetothyriales sp. CBS 135597]
MAKDRNAAAQGIGNLLTKLNDPDPDIRFMQLNDLNNILVVPASEYIKNDNHTASRVMEGVLKSLTDQHGEVQNQALKCVGPLASRLPGNLISALIDKITDLTTSEIDVSIPNTALRSLIGSLPQPTSTAVSAQDVTDAYNAVSRVLIPRLVGQPVINTKRLQQKPPKGLLEQQKDNNYSAEAVDVMIEIVKCYGQLLSEKELVELARATMNIIESPAAGGVVKKRALAGIAALLVHFSDAQVGSIVAAIDRSFQIPNLTNDHRRFLIATIGTLARAIPVKFGPHIDSTAPSVLSPLSEQEADRQGENSDDEHEADPEVEELRETALIALEALVGSCPAEMKPYRQEATDATLRYLKYNPNVNEFDDEDMTGTQDAGSEDGITEEVLDEDDEYAELDGEDGLSDVDDLSWKVRRCSAKALLTIINSSSLDDHAALFGSIGPVLISRLRNESEDGVKMEVMAATTALIRKSSTLHTHGSVGVGDGLDSLPANSRKRRRQDSEVSQADPDLRGLVLSRSSPPIVTDQTPTGAQADLAALVPKIVQALSKLWKKASIPLKQSAIIMLKTLATSRNGALADHLQHIEDLVADALKPGTGPISYGLTASSSSATIASLQIETLSLISAITETNPATVLIPFVIALIPPVATLVNDRNFKVSIEALATTEQFVKVLTPPRLQTASTDHAIHIEKLYGIIVDRVTDNQTDLDVRHRAIEVFGVLLDRTSSTQLLPSPSRAKGLGILSDRLKNETTRLAAARAIGLVAESATIHNTIDTVWVREVSLEMANQLRKADRALRAACLEALQFLALNPVTTALYETDAIAQLKTQLLPLLSSTDLHLLTPALIIFAKIIPTNAQALVTADLVQSLANLSRTRLEGPPLKAYLLVIKVVGENGAGSLLMRALLDVGLNGETTVLGRAVGTLLVFTNTELEHSVSSFLRELETSTEPATTCLALSVLGEVGFRLGAASPIKMAVFIKYLTAESDKVRLSAATALGSASSSNISECLPVILQSLSPGAAEDYVYLHALKEILVHTEIGSTELAPFAGETWNKLFTVSTVEDNRAVCSECIGRLAIIEPTTYIPELSKALQDSDVKTRGLVISAFRFTLAETRSSYNTLLANIITPTIKAMLADDDLGNRREAVITLDAAIKNKAELIIPSIDQFLPQILQDSQVKPELVKSVSVGPFKHLVDFGMDLRKSTYNILYTLLDTPKALPRLPRTSVYDRILAGITDDADIRNLCLLMIGRLTQIYPDETRRRLNLLAEKFKLVLGQKVKENAVKHDIEKVADANAAVVRATLELDKALPTAVTDGSPEAVLWRSHVEYVRRDFAGVVNEVTTA